MTPQSEETATSIDIVRNLEYNIFVFEKRQWEIPSANEEVYGSPADFQRGTLLF